MAVLNPPRVLPGLGRSIVNFLLENRNTWDDAALVEVFKPAGVNDEGGAGAGVRNTLSAFRAIGVLESGPDGSTVVASGVASLGRAFNRDEFRRLMARQIFDLDRDGDPWTVAEDDVATSGARDLTRALSWFLAQDVQAEPLSWTGNVQPLQRAQFASGDRDRWAIRNDTRWAAFSRWTTALGLGVPSVMRSKPGLVPLPTIAIADVVDQLPMARMSIFEFLDALAQRLPVLAGGLIRTSLIARLGSDPDPGIQAHTVDTSVAQVLRILEARGRLSFESLADAEGTQLSTADQARTTHVTLKGGKRR